MASSGRISEQGNSLTFFPPLPTDVKGPVKKSSLFDLFKRPKEKTSGEIGKDVILKSDLEDKEKEDECVPSKSTFYVSNQPRPSGSESTSSISSGVKASLEYKQRTKEAAKSANEELLIATTRDEAAGEYAPPPRTLSSVMKQISNIRKGQEHEDSGVRWHWMPDSQCKECYECGEKFTTFRRRHHCRVCGQIFCHSCCNQEVASNTIGLIEGERVCSYCDKVLRSYTNPEDTSDDLNAVREDLKKFTQESTSETAVTPRKTLSGLTDEERKQRTGSLLELDPSDPNPFEATGTSYNGVPDTLDNEWQLLLQDSAQLRDLWLLIQHPSNGITPQTHRHRLRTYHNCIIGSELVDWLIEKDKATNREQATAIGQALLEARWLRHVPGNNEELFKDDNLFYHLWQRTRPETTSEVAALTEEGEIAHKDCLTEPNWFQEIDGDQEKGTVVDIDGLDNVNSGKMFRSSLAGLVGNDTDYSITSMGKVQSDTDTDSQTGSEMHGLMPSSGIPKVAELLPSALPTGPDHQGKMIEDGLERREAEMKRQYCNSSINHLKVLLSQLLEKDKLDTAWFDIIFNLAQTICDEVKVDVFAKDLMDIRQYVHVKKLPGGNRQECEIIHGTVCTKNITNKKMIRDLTHPRILLLAAAVEHQRVENKFVSLEPVVLQEREFLKNCVSKLIAQKPEVLIVEKTVARVAQEFLLAHGITLVSNTKPLVMARIKRSTGASLEDSIEQAAKATLGSCYQFHLKVYQLPGGFSKTLMFIQGCPPRLGCSVILRGGSLVELKKVKQCLEFMIYALYHSFLESAYLFDSFALPMEYNQNTISLADPEDSPGLTGSFFEGIKSPRNGQNTDHSDLFHDNQKSVTESIKSAMHKLMKSQAMKDTTRVETGRQTGETGNKSNGTENAITQEMNATKKITTDGGIAGNDGEMDKHDEPQAQDTKNNQKLAVQEKIVRHGVLAGDVMEIESKIIPFTPLVGANGADLALTGMFTLATPIRVEHFKDVLKETKLSSSPYIVQNPPFFETDQGQNSTSKKFFCDNIFLSPKLSNSSIQEGRTTDTETVNASRREIERDCHFYRSLDRSTKPSRHVKLKNAHPFIDFPHLSDDDNLSALVADFRARGGRLVSLPKHHQSLETLGAASQKKSSDSSMMPSGSQTLPSQFKDGEFKDTDVHKNYSQIENMKAHRTSNGAISDDCGDKVDCMDPYFHQRLTMQFSSFSSMSDNSPSYCIHPRTIQMEHYDRNDVTLGHFLDKFCFNTLYTCRSKSCEALMLQHIRRFVHSNGCIEIILRVMEVPITDGWEDILVWSWCRRCQEVLPCQTLSRDAWQMSFSKFLELRFLGRDYTSRANLDQCGHSLLLHHNQYFSRGKIVATFKYHPINVREVVLPLLPLPDQKPFLMFQDPEKEYTNIDNKGTNLLSSILEHITILTETSENCTYLEDKRAEYCGMYEDHQMLFKKHLLGLQEKMSDLNLKSDSNEDKETEMLVLQDAFVNARRALAQIGMAWDMRLQEFLFQEKERKRREQGRRKASEDGSASPRFTLSTSHEEASSNTSMVIPEVSEETSSGSSSEVITMETNQRTDAGVSGEVDTLDLNNDSITPKDNISVTSSASGEQMGMDQTDQVSLQMAAVVGIPTTDSRTYRSLRSMLNNLMTDQSAQIKLDLPFPPDQHYIMPPCNIASVVIFDKEPSSIIAYTLSSDKYKEDLKVMESERQFQSVSSSTSKVPSGGTSSAGTIKGTEKADKNDSGTRPKNSKPKNAKRVLNFLWNKGNNPSAKLDEVTDEGDMETEFALNGSFDSKEEGDLDFPKSGKDSDNSPSILCQYTDPTNSQFWCQVYYPSQFTHLRKLLFPSGEDVFIRSLARCNNWKATGGKSGSKFSKTEDDRFILKEIQRTESHSFLQFAPHYIKYMEKAARNNQPTVLTKILGFYTIGCKNPVTNTAQKQHVVVMENLFYKRHIPKIFDLKGSIRNRHVKTSGDGNQHTHVLMDENLIKEMVKSPLYIPLHSKSILAHAFEADTRLLARHFVMDYSLLVGIDEEHNELVVGIIDFIRKFTFDKKLEMIVKASGIVGGHGKTPTILSPELYRSRFCEAMDKYFVLVPDRWTGLGKDIYGS